MLWFLIAEVGLLGAVLVGAVWVLLVPFRVSWAIVPNSKLFPRGDGAPSGPVS